MNNNKKRIAALAYIYVNVAMNKKKTRRERRWWMTNLFLKRENVGSSEVMRDLQFQHVSGQYKNFTRMTPSDFEFLLNLVGNDIAKKDTTMRQAISVQDRLALTLRFLASGDSYTSLQYLFRISKPAISKIVPETCHALVKALKNQGYIKIPDDKSEWSAIAEEFNTNWNFPHCLGSLDGKHVALIAPASSASTFHNFKHFFNIIMFAAVDSNYQFIFVDVGNQGSLGDSTVFAECWLGKQLYDGKLCFPDAQSLTEERDRKVPYFFIGDEAFALHKNLMRAFAGYCKPQSKQRVFNYRLCRARRVVENVFGIATSVFRLLRKPKELEPDKAQTVVLCIAYLHNFLRKSSTSRNLYTPPGCFDREENGILIEGSWRENGNVGGALRPLQKIPRRSTLSAEAVREELANYFMEDGKVSWQDSSCS